MGGRGRRGGGSAVDVETSGDGVLDEMGDEKERREGEEEKEGGSSWLAGWRVQVWMVVGAG